MAPFSLDSLARVVRGPVTTGPDELARVGRDGSHLVGHPAACVAPHDRADVVALVAWARQEGVALVARGGGTSLDGESVPADGSIVVDLSSWNRVLEVEPVERWARVEPGVVNFDLQRALAPQAVFFPPNPGSWKASTIGGNVGTNASGPRSYRYGPTRAWIRELEVVLGTGERVRLGTRADKRSLGPDLLALFVGSEGTLGIVTEVTVRLARLPPVRRGLVLSIPAGSSIGEVPAVLSATPGTGLSAIEYLDRDCAAALVEDRSAEWPSDSALLVLEVEADHTSQAEERTATIREALRLLGVTRPPVVFDDSDRLWTLRGESSVVLDERVGQRVREDVAVPLRSIGPMVGELERIAREEGVRMYLFAHLGEGSLHPNFIVDPASDVAARVRARTLESSLRLGGTISAEHGVGRLKAPFVVQELGAGPLRLLEDVKRACDPDRILNPGVLYPAPRGGAGSSPSPSAAAGGRARPE